MKTTTMTADQLRAGAALARALVEGDETARLPLADFIEEHGLPGQSEVIREAVESAALRLLRSPDPLGNGQAVRTVDGDVHATVQGFNVWWGNSHSIGVWPAWAWEATQNPPTEAK